MRRQRIEETQLNSSLTCCGRELLIDTLALQNINERDAFNDTHGFARPHKLPPRVT